MRRFLLICICLLALCATVYAADAEISAMHAQAEVYEDGSCKITVSADVNFSTAPKTFLLPLGADADEIVLAGWSYDEVEINGVTCLRLTNEAGFTGKQTFSCSYVLPCGVTETDTGQRFRLRLPESGWEYAIANYSLQITFPVEVTQQPTWVSGYYGDVIDNYLDIAIEGGSILVKSIAQMKDHETLQMDLQFAAGTFDLRNLPGKTASIDLILFFILLVLAVVYWFFRLRYGFVFPRQQQTANMEAAAGEIPCELFGEMPDAAGILAHWGNLGYLSIRRTARGRILLQKQMEMGNERKPAERKFFAALFRGNTVCDVQSLRYKTAVKAMRRPMRGVWLRRMYSPRSGNPFFLRCMGVLAGICVSLLIFDALLPAKEGRWIFLPMLTLLGAALHLLLQRGMRSFFCRRRLLRLTLGAVSFVTLLILGNSAGRLAITILDILLQCFCGLTTMFGGKRTEAGQDQVRRLLGLRRFLHRAQPGVLQKHNYNDPQYFYRMLPFAEALGVGAAFARRFGSRLSESCTWLHDAARLPMTPLGFYQRYEEIFSTIRGEFYRPIGRNGNFRAPAAPPAAAVGSRRPHRSAEYEFDE